MSFGIKIFDSEDSPEIEYHEHYGDQFNNHRYAKKYPLDHYLQLYKDVCTFNTHVHYSYCSKCFHCFEHLIYFRYF